MRRVKIPRIENETQMNTSNETILLSVDANIATMTFNRPEVFNAMNSELIHAFAEITNRLKTLADIRVLIVRGAGKAFLAGGDVGMFHARKDDPTLAADVKPLGDALHAGIINLRELPFPVVAEIQGACAGAGVSVALACDFAIASEKAMFNTAYTKIGLSPDGGSTWFLPRMVGMKKAAELIMLAENIDAKTALELGLVNRVVAQDALRTEVDALAARLAKGATTAFANTKRLLNQSFTTPIQTHLDDEIALFAKASQTNDFKEGVTAFVEKRAPEFKGS
jgi:2-(1,2-epoxy-1,2-dihydrophenyl)acetyl-CoA isomerase